MKLISTCVHKYNPLPIIVAQEFLEIHCRLLIQSSPVARDRQRFIRKSEKHFLKSDESAYSIVPSHMSSRLSVSTCGTRKSWSTSIEKEMVYHRLSFENDLFTSRVYKRNYRFPQLLKAKERGSSGTPSSTKVATAVSDLDARIPNSEESRPSLMLGNHDPPPRLDSSSNGRQLPPGMPILDTDQEKPAARDKDCLSPRIIVTCPLDEFKPKSKPGPYPGRWPKARKGYLTVPFPDAIKWQNIESHGSDRLVKSRSYLPPAHSHLDFANGKSTRSRILNLRSKILVIACKKGDYVRVKEMLDLGCNVHAQGTFPADFGFQAIHGVAEAGHHAIMQLLIQRGASVEDRTTSSRSTSLVLATQSGSIRVIELLLKSGALVATPNDLGEQSIHLAAKHGQVDALRLLVENGARLDCVDNRGHLPIHHAAEASPIPEIIKSLVVMGAKIDARSIGPSEEYPLNMACRRNNGGTLRMLLALGAGDADQDLYESALYSAIKHGSLTSLKNLLSHGRKLRGIDPKWIVAIKLLPSRLNPDLSSMMASSNARSRLVDCLAMFALRYETPSSRFNASLDKGLYGGKKNISTFLEDPNTTDELGISILGEAIREHKRELSICLFDSGVRLLSKTDDRIMKLQLEADEWWGKRLYTVSMRDLNEQIMDYQNHHQILHDTIDDLRALGLQCFGRHVQAENGIAKPDHPLPSCPYLGEWRSGINECVWLCPY